MTQTYFPSLHAIREEVRADIGFDPYAKTNRLPENVQGRQIGWYLARKLTKQSLARIGHQLGGVNHATVVHGIRKIAEARAVDARLATFLAALESRLTGGHAPRIAAPEYLLGRHNGKLVSVPMTLVKQLAMEICDEMERRKQPPLPKSDGATTETHEQTTN